MNAIEIKNLHFSYGKENVLDGVSLCLKEGRLAILAGENGAGKSTLLRILLGELPIGESHKGDQEEGSSDGSIEILGQDIRQFKDWSSISYVPQNGMGGWKDFPASVEEIVRANLYKQIGLFRFAGKKERQQVRAALAQVGMLFELAAVFGRGIKPERGYEVAGVLAGGLVIRAVTRALVKQTPHIGFAVKALTAAAGTYGMGRALVSLYERDVDYSRANEVVTATFSRVRDLVTTVAGATRPMASYQDASDLAA